jgi:hypothetical protein
VSRANATLASMGKELVSDELWKVTKSLLPPETQKPKGGRPRVPVRAALSGIVFVLRTGISWSMLPTELGFVGIATAACDDVAPQYIPDAWSSFLKDMRKVSAPRPPESISAKALFQPLTWPAFSRGGPKSRVASSNLLYECLVHFVYIQAGKGLLACTPHCALVRSSTHKKAQTTTRWVHMVEQQGLPLRKDLLHTEDVAAFLDVCCVDSV